MPAHWLQVESCRAGFKSGGKDQLNALFSVVAMNADTLANDSTKPFGHGKSTKARLSRLYSYRIVHEDSFLYDGSTEILNDWLTPHS